MPQSVADASDPAQLAKTARLFKGVRTAVGHSFRELYFLFTGMIFPDNMPTEKKWMMRSKLWCSTRFGGPTCTAVLLCSTAPQRRAPCAERHCCWCCCLCARRCIGHPWLCLPGGGHSCQVLVVGLCVRSPLLQMRCGLPLVRRRCILLQLPEGYWEVTAGLAVALNAHALGSDGEGDESVILGDPLSVNTEELQASVPVGLRAVCLAAKRAGRRVRCCPPTAPRPSHPSVCAPLHQPVARFSRPPFPGGCVAVVLPPFIPPG